MEKINIAELLKDCPKGMNLDCTVYDNCTLETVFEGCLYPIQIQTPEGLINLTKYGSMSQSTHSKCVIFPKGKTAWEGFQMPFKNGDIVATSTGNWIGITTGGEKNCFIPTYCIINNDGKFEAYFDRKGKWEFSRLATEEEKQKLFQAIEDNGYKWNAETKTLEKLPKFKVGDVIVNIHSKHLHCDGASGKISQITDDKYIFTDGSYISISNQDDWELVPNKFDITTLKPFDKVFVRDNNTQEWVISFFSHCNGLEIYKYSCINGHGYAQCVPYEENKHLLGTTNDCDDFYKTWK